MYRHLTLLLLAAAFGCALLGGKTPSRQIQADKNAGLQYLEDSFPQYDALQKKIHSFAEPGYQETRSSAALSGWLEDNGFSVQRGIAGIPTAFVARYGSGSPVIGLMAEFDALPGMSQDTVTLRMPRVEGGYGHGCAHNLLGTAAVAGAVSISRYLASGHQGTVLLFGCPAEEGGSGKAYLVMDGFFDECDLVMDWHPHTANTVRLSEGLANVSAKFTFHGVSSHASDSPWNGRSALDAVEAMDHMMNLMREHLPPQSRIHYVITDGGKAPNIVPERAQVYYYLRHPHGEFVQEMLQRTVAAAEGAAKGTGTTMTYELIHGNYETTINRHLAEMMLRNLVKVGGLDLDAREQEWLLDIMPECGLERDSANLLAMTTVVPEIDAVTEDGASTDVGNVSRVVPVARLEMATSLKGIHTWQQAATAGTTIGTKALLGVAKVFFLTAVDLYNSPADVSAIRSEFEARFGKEPVFEPLQGHRTPPLDYRK